MFTEYPESSHQDLQPYQPNSGSFQAEHFTQAEARTTRLKQLEDGITTLAAHMDAAMFRWLELVREFDALSPEQRTLFQKALEANMDALFAEQKNVPAERV